MKFGNDKVLLELQKGANLDIATMEAKYKQALQGSVSATSVMRELSSSVDRIMANTATDGPAKQKQLDYQYSIANQGLTMAYQFSGDVRLDSLLAPILNLLDNPATEIPA